MACLLVHRVGALATVQDLGRPGYAGLGVSRSGAADRRSLRAANRLVGNEPGTAAIEALLGGLVVAAHGDLVVAVTGAEAELSVDGRPAPFGRPFVLPAGSALHVGMPAHGLRCYLAVRTGLAVARTLGSAATDVTSRLGPPPLAPGDVLQVGGAHPVAAVDTSPVDPVGGGPVRVSAMLGPRDDWFTGDAVELFGSTVWRVSGDLDRVGIRLDGPRLRRAIGGELPSEGMVRGAVQVPPSGTPVVLLADHPVTGGYPVIAVVDDADTDRLGQLRPGDELSFRLRTGRVARA